MKELMLSNLNLGIMFMVLKIAGVVDWSWTFVLLPFWFWPAVLVIAVAVSAVKFAYGKGRIC